MSRALCTSLFCRPVADRRVSRPPLLSNLSPVLIDRVWKGVGGATPNSLPVVASAFNANLSSWTEHFTLTPACLGKATDFSWTASYCSTNDPVAESLYSAAHTGPFEGLEAQFGTYTSCKAI